MRWETRAGGTLDGATMYALLRLRQEVFVVEQACAYLDADGRDLDALQVLGFEGDALVACARVLAPGVAGPLPAIGRVVTAPSVRGTGVGHALVQQAVAACEAAYPGLPIDGGAQAHLVGFYAQHGFEVCGPGYDEDGIPHLPVRRAGRVGPG